MLQKTYLKCVKSVCVSHYPILCAIEPGSVVIASKRIFVSEISLRPFKCYRTRQSSFTNTILSRRSKSGTGP